MMVTLRKPKQFNDAQLALAGIEILDRNPVTLRCATCGQTWQPVLGEGGRLLVGYWKCPNGCNAEAE